MKQHRRTFIRQTSAALLAGFSLHDLEQRKPMPLPGNYDEAYWTTIRDQFPLKNELAYLNTGSLGPSPFPVIDEVKKGMMDTEEWVKYDSGEHAVKRIASFTGSLEQEIALTHNTTEGINIMCWGLPLKKGDEVIMTTHEHAGNALPWLNRQKLDGIVIRTFSPASTSTETLNRLSSLINKKTKAIAVPHILCSQGQILPVKEISKLGKEKGLFVCLDGAHGPGMIPLDLHDIGCDAYAACGHKWMLGPKGTGFLYVRKDFQDTLQTRFVGAGSDDASWNMSLPSPHLNRYADSAHRYFGGTQNTGLFMGVEAAIGFAETIGMDQVHARIKTLGTYLQQELLKLENKIELLTPVEPASYCGMSGFRIVGVPFDLFYNKALEQNIRIRIMYENSLNSLRVSTHIYNSTAEIDRLIELIKKSTL